MPNRPRSVAVLAAYGLLAVATAGGCSDTTAVSAAGQGASMYKVEAVPSEQVVVTPPTVVVRSGVMTIAGEVRRKPGVTGVLDGQVMIDLVGPDGLDLDKPLHAPLTPTPIPDDPNVAVRYAPTPFGYVPPAGSTVRARYIDRNKAILEKLQDGALDFTGNGGHTGTTVSPDQHNGSDPAVPNSGGTK